MYIVIGQESHPDHFLEDQAYGPFETYEEADAFAKQKTHSPGNDLSVGGVTFRFRHAKYSYSVIELVTA